jgi:putative protease
VTTAQKIELLAPVGTLETFHAALDGGADAVYVGAPGFNARNLARDLRLEEIAAMISHCHNLGKKLYIAANSLILERELSSVIENLALLEQLQPDALIVQDPGIGHLVRNSFPRLTLHGSTLMTVHNSDGVKFLAKQGFERVVLARELTLKEIETISVRAAGAELEVFIHGAMCFSYSGLCLFSSYLGGKSGLRGRCVQPCRRAYSGSRGGRSGKAGSKGGSKGSSKGGGEGRYIFSMNDLTGVEAVARLQELGITSLKIEGRLRSAHYVRSVVEAYRLVIDAKKERYREALTRARTLVDKAMSRKTSSGYFFTPQPAEAISHYHSGNMGTHLGRFSTVKRVAEIPTCRFISKSELQIGDRLRLHLEPSGERTAFKLRTLFVRGEPQSHASKGEKVSMELPADFSVVSGGHVEVYKVDGGLSPAGTRNRLDIQSAEKQLSKEKKRVGPKVKQLISLLCVPEVTSSAGAAGGAERSGNIQRAHGARKKIGIQWWLKSDSLKVILGKMSFHPDRYLLSFEKQLLTEVGRIKNALGKRSRLVSWALPPLIMEKDLGRVKKQIAVLLRSGFRSFQIGHISQVELFRGEKVHLFGDYTLNVINSQAFAQLRAIGLDSGQAGIELDKTSLEQLLVGCSASGSAAGGKISGGKTAVGLYVYGAPALYTARLAASHFQYDQQIQSPRKEPYVIVKKEGYTQTFPDKPFSLLPYLEEIRDLGVSYVVVDTCGHSSKKEILELQERLGRTGRYRKLPTFNYLGSLQ